MTTCVHEADLDYLTGDSLCIYAMRSLDTGFAEPILESKRHVRLCKHCACLFAEPKP